jgi:hypothetical protein
MEKKRVTTAQQLIDFVHSSTPLTEDNYPVLAQLSGDPREHFIVGHSLRHLSKSVGKMQAFIEAAEHGESLNKEKLKEKVIAASFSICKLCAVLGISGDELVAGVAGMAQKETDKENFLNETTRRIEFG